MEKEAAAVAAEREAKRLEFEAKRVEAELAARANESLALRNMIYILTDRSNTSSETDYEQLVATIAAATAKQASSSPLPEKITFSKCDGKMDALVIHSWFHQFTSYFAITQKTDTQKVLLAMMHLTGDAITWKEEWVDKKLAAHMASVGWTEDNGPRIKPLTYVWADFRDALTARSCPHDI